MKFIRLDLGVSGRKDISPLDKLVFGVIATYDMKYGCKLSNQEISELLGINRLTVSRSISKLSKLNLVTSPKTRKEQSQNRVLKIEVGLYENDERGYTEDNNPTTEIGLYATVEQVIPNRITGYTKDNNPPEVLIRNTHAERLKRDSKREDNIPLTTTRAEADSEVHSSGRSEVMTTEKKLKDTRTAVQKFWDSVGDLLGSGRKLSEMTPEEQAILVVAGFCILIPGKERPTPTPPFVRNRSRRIQEKFGEGYDAEYILRAMWQLSHCKYANGENGWAWTLNFLLYGSSAVSDPLDRIQDGYMKPDCKVTQEELNKIAPYEKLLVSPLPRYGKPESSDVADETPVRLR